MAMGGWNRGRVLGRGSTATVSLASARNSGELFAVKSVELAYCSVLQRERTILSSLDCKHVVSCLGHDLSAGHYNLFLEYAPGGSLADEILRRGGSLPEPSLRSRAREVLAGLAYLHSRGIVHCDIKSQNILICSDGQAKIADLGCARLFDEGGSRLSGTPMFMAPEVARGERQGPAADVWAVGCVAVEMATGRAPWPDVPDAISVLHRIGFSGDVPAIPEWMSEEGKDFLSRCLRRDPDQRWTADQLLTHPFLQNLQEKEPIQWTSPKSILDRSIWESLEEEEADHHHKDDEAACVAPQRMIADLVGSSGTAPNWTWDEDWLTVRTDDERECPAPEPVQVVGDGSVIFDTVISNNAIIGNEGTVIYAIDGPEDLRSGPDDILCRGIICGRDLVAVSGHLNLLDYRSGSMNCNHFVHCDRFTNESLLITFHSSYCFCFSPLFVVLCVVL